MTARTAVANGEPDEPNGRDLTLRDLGKVLNESPLNEMIQAFSDAAMTALVPLVNALFDSVWGRGPISDVQSILHDVDLLDTPLPELLDLLYDAVRHLANGESGADS